MREPEVYNPKCACGRPIPVPHYHRACNLVFCQFCIGAHDCRPVNGPISAPEVGLGRPVSLPAAPDRVRGVKLPEHRDHTTRNGSSKNGRAKR